MRYYLVYSPSYALIKSSSEIGAIRWYKKIFTVTSDTAIEIKEVSKSYAVNELWLFGGLTKECASGIVRKRKCGVLLKQTVLFDDE